MVGCTARHKLAGNHNAKLNLDLGSGFRDGRSMPSPVAWCLVVDRGGCRDRRPAAPARGRRWSAVDRRGMVGDAGRRGADAVARVHLHQSRQQPPFVFALVAGDRTACVAATGAGARDCGWDDDDPGRGDGGRAAVGDDSCNRSGAIRGRTHPRDLRLSRPCMAAIQPNICWERGRHRGRQFRRSSGATRGGA